MKLACDPPSWDLVCTDVKLGSALPGHGLLPQIWSKDSIPKAFSIPYISKKITTPTCIDVACTFFVAMLGEEVPHLPPLTARHCSSHICIWKEMIWWKEWMVIPLLEIACCHITTIVDECKPVMFRANGRSKSMNIVKVGRPGRKGNVVT